jgi:hypothetical protein
VAIGLIVKIGSADPITGKKEIKNRLNSIEKKTFLIRGNCILSFIHLIPMQRADFMYHFSAESGIFWPKVFFHL